MVRLFSLLLFSFIFTAVSAQFIEVQLIEKQDVPVAGGAFYPKFSPDGSYLLLTSVNYSGLQKWEPASRKLQKLTDEPGAGYAARISDDGHYLSTATLRSPGRASYACTDLPGTQSTSRVLHCVSKVRFRRCGCCCNPL